MVPPLGEVIYVLWEVMLFCLCVFLHRGSNDLFYGFLPLQFFQVIDTNPAPLNLVIYLCIDQLIN